MTDMPCAVSAGFQRLAIVRLASISLLLIVCLAHAIHDLPVSLALPCSVWLVWAACGAWYWTLKRASRRQGNQPDPAEKEFRQRRRDEPPGLSAGAVHELSTPLSTMLLLVGELRRVATPPADWKECIDTLWEQLQLCKRVLNASLRPGPAARSYADPDPAAKVALEKGEQR